ncbi:hypothetical protein QL285_028912 [Trifolium repens]|nr:hypothetical protein QL285_028912 [Trifolium repens]
MGGWRGAWEWRRHLWAWEEELLRECQALLLPVILQVASPDRWQWRPDPAAGYSVHDAYQILTSHDSVILGEAEALICHRQVPLKVSVLAWRLLRDRLPTRANLVSRGILAPDLHDCVTGCGGIETARHCFYHAALLALFGLWSGLGLSSRRWMLSASQTTSSSSLILLVASAPGGRSCSSSGLLVFG